MPDSNYDKLKKVLDDLFMFDQADLDFGIYRIINVRRAEIRRFLDNDLLPQVKAALGELAVGDRDQIEGQLREAEEQARGLGMNPDDAPKVKELRAKLADMPDGPAAEDEVYSHLAGFFRRYYSEGDFISQRRYKEGVYAIPYEGEEVKLHWANADQYYIKSSEQFRDYTFLLADGRRVHFKLVEADTERNNNRTAAGKDRRFILAGADPVSEQDGELLIRFEYRPDPEGRKREAIDRSTVEAVLSDPVAAGWHAALRASAPTSADPGRTILAKHVAAYSGKNTFDYFIHKDLGTFLRRELDFYLKNEVMHLDDIDTDDAQALKVAGYLAKLKAIRRIAHKIIDFVAQLENFQKRLWLKKKFVVETTWCVTLDRIDPSLYPEIAANDAQRVEWVRLFAIDDLAGNRPPYSAPLTVAFLQANSHLPVDTALFSPAFTEKLLAGIDDLDEVMDGLLIHSENFQALNLLQARLRGQVKCIYIDPPYNTSSSAIPYKNDYKHAAWITMMHDRLEELRELLQDAGALFVSIDKVERFVLEYALDDVFGPNNLIQELIWSMNTNNSQAPNYSTNHEYVLVYARDRVTVESERAMFREPKPGFLEVMSLVAELNPDYPTVDEIESRLKSLYELHRLEYREQVEASGLEWSEEAGNDPWKGLFNYNRAEYRSALGQYVSERDARVQNARIWVWRESDPSMPATKQSSTTADPSHRNWRWYEPMHPATRKLVPHPKSGWKFAYDDDEDSPDRRSFVSLDRDHRIAWGTDEKKIPQLKRMLHEVETNVAKSVFRDYSDGEKQTSAMFGRSGVFLAPKHSDFVSRFIVHARADGGYVLDCFGGSGSTAQAVLNLNRDDHGARKFILVEMGEYFDTVLKPRVLKAAYSRSWKSGKPVSRDGVSQLIKVIRLETYEDTLNNLRVPDRREPVQQRLLDENTAAREEYMLRYWVDMETRGSPSLLTVEQFEDPWAYDMEIARGSAAETRPVKVDLVETFNYLVGLRVKHVDVVRGVTMIQGTLPSGEKALVIWRKTAEMPSDELDRFLFSQSINPRDMEFAVIYVNGDNHLENSRRLDETWKVRLIEDEFRRLMFEEADR